MTRRLGVAHICQKINCIDIKQFFETNTKKDLGMIRTGEEPSTSELGDEAASASSPSTSGGSTGKGQSASDDVPASSIAEAARDDAAAPQPVEAVTPTLASGAEDEAPSGGLMPSSQHPAALAGDDHDPGANNNNVSLTQARPGPSIFRRSSPVSSDNGNGSGDDSQPLLKKMRKAVSFECLGSSSDKQQRQEDEEDPGHGFPDLLHPRSGPDETSSTSSGEGEAEASAGDANSLQREMAATSTPPSHHPQSPGSYEGGRDTPSPPPPWPGEVPPAPPSTPASVVTNHSQTLADQHDMDAGGDFGAMATPLPQQQLPPPPPMGGGGADVSVPTHVSASSSNAAQHHHQRQEEEGQRARHPQQDYFDESQPTTHRRGGGAARHHHPQPAAKASVTKSPKDEFDDWAVGDRYSLVRMLGRGSYGEVAQARDLGPPPHRPADGDGEPPKHVAVKRITSAFESEVDAIRLYREMSILRRLGGHDCIIQLLDVVQPPSDDLDDFHDLYLVFEYVDTDLYKLIMSPQYLTTEHIQTFLYQMLTGLKYIHSSSVIHRDLKPANILLNEDCSLKICDFGLARIVNNATMLSSSASNGDDDISGDTDEPLSLLTNPLNNQSGNSEGPPKTATPKPGLTRQLTKHVVTRWYRAPELILIQPYTSAVDIWSLGCILAELLSMQEGSVPGYQDRVPLFPGGSCYPLSGEGAAIKNDERLDQLSVIFGVIGTPDAEDVESIGKANEYISTLEKKPGRPLESLYPAADPTAIDLLKKMLQFNPRKRCTADEALEHEFLKGVRRKDMEKSADQPLVGPKFLETNNVDIATLKQRTYEEVLWYKEHGG